MSNPRRRILRFPTTSRPADSQRQSQRLRSRLSKERSALARWMTRLRRAFHAVEKHQVRIARLERQLTKEEA